MAPQRQAAATIDACCPDDYVVMRKRGWFEWDNIYIPSTIAEFLGTLFVNFFTTATLLLFYYLTQNRECCAAGRFEAALGAGLAIYVAVKVLGWLRGAHFNPVITLVFMFSGKTPVLHALLLWIAQLAAGFTSGGIVSYLWAAFEPTLGTPALAGGFTAGRAYFLVWFTTMFVALFVLIRSKRCYINALSYGGTTVVAMLALTQFVGTTLSPFHYLGLAVFSGIWTDWIVYLIFPWVGAFTGFVVYALVFITVKNAVAVAKKAAKKIRANADLGNVKTVAPADAVPQ